MKILQKMTLLVCVILTGCAKDKNSNPIVRSPYPVIDTFSGLYTGHYDNAFAGFWDTSVIVDAYIKRISADSAVLINPVFGGSADGGTPTFDKFFYKYVRLNADYSTGDSVTKITLRADSLTVVSLEFQGGSTSNSYVFKGYKK